MRFFRFSRLLSALMLVGLPACDRIGSDVAPDPAAGPAGFRTVYSLPGDDVTISLAAATDGVTTYRVGTSPRFGKLNFLTNGYLLYRPDSTLQEAEDQFTLNRTAGNGPVNDTIRVVIKPKPEQLPCNAGAQADAARTLPNTPVTIDVIANDRFCSGEFDPGSLKVGIAPQHGTTEVKGKTIIYKPATGFLGTDSFVYVYHLAGSTDLLAAAVKVAVEPPVVGCQVTLAPDAASVKEGTPEVVLAVLKNDRLCDKPGTVSLKTLPRAAAGTVTVNAANEVVFKPAPGFSGTLDFTYQVCFANGKECPTAVVKIAVEPLNPACQNHTEADKVTVKLGGDRVEIPVLANDVLCSPAASLAIGTKPLLGKAEIDGLKVFYTPPKTGESDKFTYEITTTKGGKVTGTVAVALRK